MSDSPSVAPRSATRTVVDDTDLRRSQIAADAAKRRDSEVLAAAAKVFARRGYAAASVKAVADELGIVTGSLYHYIGTKEDLLFRLLDAIHDAVDAVLAGVAAEPDLPPLERLRLYLRRQVEYHVSVRDVVSVYYQDIDCLREDHRLAVLKRRHAHEQYVVSLITAAQADGDADPTQDPALLAATVFATVIWTHQWYRPDRDTPQEAAERCADFALCGVIGDRSNTRQPVACVSLPTF